MLDAASATSTRSTRAARMKVHKYSTAIPLNPRPAGPRQRTAHASHRTFKIAHVTAHDPTTPPPAIATRAGTDPAARSRRRTSSRAWRTRTWVTYTPNESRPRRASHGAAGRAAHAAKNVTPDALRANTPAAPARKA